MKKVLVSCPPMLGILEQFHDFAASLNLELVPAKTTQVLSEPELIDLLPEFEGWIIGDDPASYQVFEAGKNGKLKAAVKWGIGVDNVDFDACDALSIPITNTPNMFGAEVAELAISYMIALARETFSIDRGIREGLWPKPSGTSIAGKTIGIVGFGDIGQTLVKRLSGFDVHAVVYDPGVSGNKGYDFVERAEFPSKLETLDFLVFVCSLNDNNLHMLNAHTLSLMNPNASIVNVARGPLIDEAALTRSLQAGNLKSAALDVFEVEPLPMSSPLRSLDNCIFGSHNGSNTTEAVIRASHSALSKLAEFLHD